MTRVAHASDCAATMPHGRRVRPATTTLAPLSPCPACWPAARTLHQRGHTQLQQPSALAVLLFASAHPPLLPARLPAYLDWTAGREGQELIPDELDPKVVEVYQGVGKVLSRYTAGKVGASWLLYCCLCRAACAVMPVSLLAPASAPAAHAVLHATAPDG